MVSKMFLTKLHLNKANSFDNEAPYLQLHLFIADVEIPSTIYDERDDFKFEVPNFPFLDGDVPPSPPCGVYISEHNRFARVCSSVSVFNSIHQI